MAEFNNRNFNGRKRVNAPHLRDVSKGVYTPPPVEKKVKKKKRKKRNLRLNKQDRFMILGGGLLLVILIAIITIFSRNAYDVTVSGKSVGVIKKTNIEVSDIKNTVVAGLEQKAGSKIELNEEIGLKSVRASKKDMVTVDYAISKIKEVVTYKVEASVITVDGKEVAVLSNKAEAEKILEDIKSEYIPEDKKDKMEASFVEEVQIVSKYVDSKEISKPEVVKDMFVQTTKVQKQYTVDSGDTVSKIAGLYSMTLDELYAENQGLTTNIHKGQVVNVLVDKPMLSVKTAETNVFTEIAKKQVKYQTDTSKPSSYQKVIQQGSDGQKEVTVQTIRINGFEEDEVIISEKIIQDPVDEIIEVGRR